MLLTSLPYLIGYAYQGDEWHFTGFLIGVEDGNTYIAKMLSGAAGNWLFRSPYSAEDQAGVIAFLPYLLLGKLTAGIGQHEQLVALFHLYRIFAGILVTLAIYDFITLFIKHENQRIWALITILLGGGMGWVVAIVGLKNYLGSIPLDFLSPESFGFLGLFGLPHLALARALLFWGVTLYLGKDRGIKTGFLWLAMGFFQPMSVVIIWVVIGIHSLVEIVLDRFYKSPDIPRWSFDSSYLKKALIAGVISCPLVFYTAWTFKVDPYLIAWTSQNFLPSPHWFHYLIAYGLVLPFAVWGVFKHIKISPKFGIFLACWMVAFPVLVNAPVTTQRRLAEGIWVILITGVFGIFVKARTLPVYGKLLLGFLYPTTIFLLWGASMRASQPTSPIFIATPQAEAFLALKKIAPQDSIVLSSFEVGNSLPAWAPLRVVQGHGPETVHLPEWQSDIKRYFLDNQGQESCGKFFNERNIEFLFWGPNEQESWNWNPESKDCMKQVYNSDEFKIYQIAE